MNPDFRFEITPLKLVAGLVGLASMWCFGLLMFHATKPPDADIERARQQQRQAEWMLQQQQAVQQMEYEMRKNYNADAMIQAYTSY